LVKIEEKYYTQELSSTMVYKTSQHTYHYIFYHALLLFRYVAQRYAFVLLRLFYARFQSPLSPHPSGKNEKKKRKVENPMYFYLIMAGVWPLGQSEWLV